MTTQEGIWQMKKADVVVIGGSAAGLTAAVTARRHYGNRPVVMPNMPLEGCTGVGVAWKTLRLSLGIAPSETGIGDLEQGLNSP